MAVPAREVCELKCFATSAISTMEYAPLGSAPKGPEGPNLFGPADPGSWAGAPNGGRFIRTEVMNTFGTFEVLASPYGPDVVGWSYDTMP